MAQNQNYQSQLKIKDQQIQSLHKISIKSLIESKPDGRSDSNSLSGTENKDILVSELSHSRLLNKELDKKLDELQSKLNIQIDKYNSMLSKIKDLQQSPDKDSESFKLEIEYNQAQITEARQEIAEAWNMVEKLNEHKSTLMRTNKELQDELNAYKMFFSSKYDTLERESSSAYQTLLALRQENELLSHKIEKLMIQNKYLKCSIDQKTKIVQPEEKVLENIESDTKRLSLMQI